MTKKAVNHHYQCILKLYDEVNLINIIEEDPESLQNDLEHDYLTFHRGGLGQFKQSGAEYDPDEEWWWYLDGETHACKAISCRTEEILDEDDITFDMPCDIIPHFQIIIESKDDGETEIYHANISELGDPDRPWLSKVLNDAKATGETEEKAITGIINIIRNAFHERYHKTIEIQDDNYEVDRRQMY